MASVGSAEFNATVTAIAEQAAIPIGRVDDINVFFVLIMGAVVFVMQPGFALLTMGAVRAKSAKSVALKNIMDVAAGGIGYWLFGWAFAYGVTTHEDGSSSGSSFIGSTWFAMSGTPSESYHTWFFQLVFAVSTATIVSGAVAERVKFQAYALYALFLTAWVYPVLSHWVWSTTGWASTTRTTGALLIGSGAYDTVGSGTVHMVGGCAGLAGAIVAGPRLGRFDEKGRPRAMPGHSAPLYLTGVLLLWFGFLGFNAGTMGAIIAPDGSSYSVLPARCFVSTMLGASFGGCTALLVSLLYHYIKGRHIVWDLHDVCNGALLGTVVITSGCATFEPWAAALGGIVGGLVIVPSSWFMLHVCKVDDPVDAFSVHGVGGALGVWWYSLMAKQGFVYELYGALNPDGVTPRHYGWWMGDDATVFGANTIWVLVIAGWTLGMMLPFFFILKKLGLLRVTAEEEMHGVDISHHNGHAYPGMAHLYDVEDSVPGKLSPSMEDSAQHLKIHDQDGLRLRVDRLESQLASLLSKKGTGTTVPHTEV